MNVCGVREQFQAIPWLGLNLEFHAVGLGLAGIGLHIEGRADSRRIDVVVYGVVKVIELANGAASQLLLHPDVP